MDKPTRRIKRITFSALAVIAALAALFFAVRAVGVALSRRTPPGGINEDMYVDVNGSQQWISIYGEDKSNPVLLYLHGGPGSQTSMYDYAFTRDWPTFTRSSPGTSAPAALAPGAARRI